GVNTSRANDEGSAFVRVRGSGRALLVAASPALTAPLDAALRSVGAHPEAATSSTMPHALAELAAYDLVALVDVPASALTEAQLDALAAYVRDLGGGLLMAGARQSFGLGGYAGTA